MILCNVRQVYLYVFGYGAALVCMARRVQTQSAVARRSKRRAGGRYRVSVSASFDYNCQ